MVYRRPQAREEGAEHDDYRRTGYSRWFERRLVELGFELWIGDPAESKAKRVKKQKNDRHDAGLLRRLMLENNFRQIWIPSPENRDLRSF